jgi:hypothetical protein
MTTSSDSPPPSLMHSYSWSDAEDSDSNSSCDQHHCYPCLQGFSPSAPSLSPMSYHSDGRCIPRRPSPKSTSNPPTELSGLSVEGHHDLALVRRAFLKNQISIADLQIQEESASLEVSAEVIARALYSRDYSVVKETLARIQFEAALSRLHASRRRLSAAIMDTRISDARITKLREEMNETDFNRLAGYHRLAFVQTSLFQSVRPILECYYATHFVGGQGVYVA